MPLRPLTATELANPQRVVVGPKQFRHILKGTRLNPTNTGSPLRFQIRTRDGRRQWVLGFVDTIHIIKCTVVTLEGKFRIASEHHRPYSAARIDSYHLPRQMGEFFWLDQHGPQRAERMQ